MGQDASNHTHVTTCRRMRSNKWYHSLAPSSSFVLLEFMHIFTGRNEVVAKVMFLLVSVILSTGGSASRRPPCQGDPPAKETPLLPRRPPTKENPPAKENPPRKEAQPPLPRRQPPAKETPLEGGTLLPRRPPRRRHPPAKETPPEGGTPPAYGQWAADRHPTGMHSCWRMWVGERPHWGIDHLIDRHNKI